MFKESKYLLICYTIRTSQKHSLNNFLWDLTKSMSYLIRIIGYGHMFIVSKHTVSIKFNVEIICNSVFFKEYQNCTSLKGECKSFQNEWEIVWLPINNIQCKLNWNALSQSELTIFFMNTIITIKLQKVTNLMVLGNIIITVRPL